MELIDKSAVVAEIENKIKKYTIRGEESDFLQDGNAKYWGGVLSCLNEIRSYLNTLEVKEVDFERELSKYISNGIHRFFPKVDDDYCRMDSVIWQDYVIETAKHFFELGLNANNNSVIEKACEWLKNNVVYTHPRTGETKCVVNLNAFIDAMKGEYYEMDTSRN